MQLFLTNYANKQNMLSCCHPGASRYLWSWMDEALDPGLRRDDVTSKRCLFETAKVMRSMGPQWKKIAI